MKPVLLLALVLLAAGVATVPGAQATDCGPLPTDPPTAAALHAVRCAHEVQHALLCLVSTDQCLS